MKEKKKNRALQVVAICVLFGSEIAVAALGGLVAAALVLPAAFSARGYSALGGEWAAVVLAAVAAYCCYHKWLFDRLERALP